MFLQKILILAPLLVFTLGKAYRVPLEEDLATSPSTTEQSEAPARRKRLLLAALPTDLENVVLGFLDTRARERSSLATAASGSRRGYRRARDQQGGQDSRGGVGTMEQKTGGGEEDLLVRAMKRCRLDGGSPPPPQMEAAMVPMLTAMVPMTAGLSAPAPGEDGRRPAAAPGGVDEDVDMILVSALKKCRLSPGEAAAVVSGGESR